MLLHQLLPRFQSHPQSNYIFTCDINASLQISGNELANIQKFNFIVNPNNPKRIDELPNIKNHTDIFVFDKISDFGMGEINNKKQITELKNLILKQSRLDKAFAKTYTTPCTVISYEKRIEYTPEPDSPLIHVINLSAEIKKKLLLPEFIENTDEIFMAEPNLFYFGHIYGLYILVKIDKNGYITIRHYNTNDRDRNPFIVMYAEACIDKLHCYYEFDNNETLCFNRRTVPKHANLIELHNTIFDYNHLEIIEKCKSASFSTNVEEDDKVRKQQFNNYMKSTKNENVYNDEDDEIEDLLYFGKTPNSLNEMKDFYGMPLMFE